MFLKFLSINLPFFFFFLLLCSFSLSSAVGSNSSSSLHGPAIGVTYTNHSSSAKAVVHGGNVVFAIQSLKMTSVRLTDPDPETIRLFSYSGITLLLNIPNSLVPEIAFNQSNALRWLNRYVVPFYPRAQISIISIGKDFLHFSPRISNLLLPAMRNVQKSLEQLGIRKISVSTTFSFVHVIKTPFPPSAAEFIESAVTETVLLPLLDFLKATNSSFLINLYPYHLYRLYPEIPLGFALFQDQPFNFRDDLPSGLRYRNLFDVMVDAVISAMDAAGHEGIPVVVTETGWPSSTIYGDHVSHAYAETYVDGLARHLRSGSGTPMRKEGVAAVYIFELFDDDYDDEKEVEEEDAEEEEDKNADKEKIHSKLKGKKWGLLYPNMTYKYHMDFSSGSDRVTLDGNQKVMIRILVVSHVSLLFLGLAFVLFEH